jgi:hypothetical protein
MPGVAGAREHKAGGRSGDCGLMSKEPLNNGYEPLGCEAAARAKKISLLD